MTRWGQLAKLTGLLVLIVGAASVDADSVMPERDPILSALIAEALENNPELAAAQKRVEAEVQRVPQARAYADPTLTLGYQNDGFGGISLGQMETTWLTIMGTQPLPWPGKRALRAEVAVLGVEQRELELCRIRLTLEADVRRAYLALQLTQDRLTLFQNQEILWKRAEQVIQTRYQVGEGAQSELLRSQLELHRLQQRRWELEADLRVLVAGLNRLRSHALEDIVEVQVPLGTLGDPRLLTFDEAAAEAEAKSPELALADANVQVARQQLELDQRAIYPDLAINAGVMPRGKLEPMWQVGISVPLPVFAPSKQRRAAFESGARMGAEELEREKVYQLLHLRVKERVERLDALVRVNRLYRDGLLVLSEATTQSTLSQYAVGRVPFAAVLEAINGYLRDHEQYLFSIADAWRIAIAQDEISLVPADGSRAGVGGSTIPVSSGRSMVAPEDTREGGSGSESTSGTGMGM